MLKNYFKKKNSGYTIIETMVAVSIFLVVVLAGMSALLNASFVHKQSEDFRSTVDNLGFIMEDMSRNIRTGYDYRCYGDSPAWNDLFAQTPEIDDPQSCATGNVIFFEAAGKDDKDNTDQWGYKVSSVSGVYNISKTEDGGDTWVQLNPGYLELDSVNPFSVLGAESYTPTPSADTQQPLVAIRLVGHINYKDTKTAFSVQTTVSQRSAD